MCYILNPNKFILRKARRKPLSRERYVGSLGSGEAGHRVGTHARQEGHECRCQLGRLHPVNRNQGAYRATQLGATFVQERKNKQKKHERRRGRASRRLAKEAAREAHNRQKETLLWR